MAFDDAFIPATRQQPGGYALPASQAADAADQVDDSQQPTQDDAPASVSPFKLPAKYQPGYVPPAAPASTAPPAPPAAPDPLSSLQTAHAAVTTRLGVVNNAVSNLTPQYDPDGQPANAAAQDERLAQQWQDAGPGATPPPPEAVTAAARHSNRRKALATFLPEQQQLTSQVGTLDQPGPLPLAIQAQQAHADLTKHATDADNYANFARQRAAILQSKGQPTDGDPIIAQASQKANEANWKANDAQASRDGALQQAQAAGHDLSPYVSYLVPPADGPKTYSVDADGRLSFDPTNPSQAVNQAVRDGVIDPASAKTTLDLAAKADQQRAVLEKMAGGAPQLKALLAGVAPGLGFVGAGTAAAAVGNAGINETISAFTGPFAPATEAVLSGAEFIGGGILGARAAKKLQEKAGEYSQTIASLNAAAQLHPGWEAAGELIPALPSAMSSVRNLRQIGSIAAADLGPGASTTAKAIAATKAVAKPVAGAALGGAGTEGILRPVVETGINKVEDQFGIEHDPVQAPTGSSVLQMAALGGLLSGHHAPGLSPEATANLLARGDAASANGVPLERALGKQGAAAYRDIAARANAKLAQKSATSDVAQESSDLPSQSSSSDSLPGQSAAPSPGSAIPSPPESQETPDVSSTPPVPSPVPPGSVAPSEGSSNSPTSDGTLPPDDWTATPSPGSTAPVPAGQSPFALAALPPAQVAAGFASRNPSAPALLPTVILKSHEYVVPSTEDTPEPVERADARLAAAQQIASIPNSPPPADGKGAYDPAKGRDTAAALFKLASGFTPDNLTASEQARLKPASGEPALVRKAPDGSTILTDAGRDTLTDAVPAARTFIRGTEAEELRTRQKPAVSPAPTAQPDTVPGETLSPGTDGDRAPDAGDVPQLPPAENIPSDERLSGPSGNSSTSPGWQSFPPESGTLGIPRDRMPQIKAEHRGAAANFLKARGIDWRNEEVPPASLKPSQAEYSPAKVERARAHQGADRRILVSSDGHVIDGHHEWLRALQDEPDTPLPVVRLDAPARDILRQAHELPSAGMDGPALESRPEPVSERGINAKKALARIDELEFQAQLEGRALTPGQQQTRAKLQEMLDGELAKQTEAARRNAARQVERSIHDAIDRDQPVDARAIDDSGIVLPAHYRRSADGISYEPDGGYAPLSQRGINAAKNLERLRGFQRSGDILTPGQRATERYMRDAFHEERAKDAAAKAPPTAQEKATLAQQEAEWREEQLRQGSEGQEGAGGIELLDALHDAGGLLTNDPVYHGEIARIRAAAQSAHVAGHTGIFPGRIFRKSAPALDELTSRLRERGFDFQTPGDMLDALEQRVATKRENFGYPARAEAESGMACARYRQATPQTPEDLQAEADKWRHILQRIAPKTTLRLEAVRRAQLSDLYGGRDRAPEGAQAVYMERTIYLVHEALVSNPDRLNFTNALHEAGHAYYDTLPAHERAALEQQWRAEIASGKSPLHGNDGRLRPDVDQRAATDVQEWFSERLAHANAEWAQGRAAERGPLARIAEGFRMLLQRIFNSIRPRQPGMADEGMQQRFREWLLNGTPEVNPGMDGERAAAGIRNWFTRDRAQDDEGIPSVNPRPAVRHDPDLGPLKNGLPPEHPLLRPTHEIDTPLRARQRAQWARHVVSTGETVPEGTRPKLWLMGGGSGSGKSTVLDKLLDSGAIPRKGTVRLDSDEIKKLIPEYGTLLRHDDAAASTVSHKESANVLDDAFRKTLAMRSNAVLDGTMSWAPHVQRIIDQARAAGYDVHMEGVAIHPDEAIRRAKQRGEEKGRVVPLRDILPRHQGFLQNVEGYAPQVDQWRLWDNNGSDALPIAEGGGGKEINRLDPEKYATFKQGQTYDFNSAIRRDQDRLQRRDTRGTSSRQSGGQTPDGGIPGSGGSAPRAGEEGTARGPGAVADGGGDARGDRQPAPPAAGIPGLEDSNGPRAAVRQTPYVEPPELTKALADDAQTQAAKQFLAAKFGLPPEKLAANFAHLPPEEFVPLAVMHGFKPGSTVDLAALGKTAGEGWTTKKSGALWQLNDGTGKMAGVGITADLAKKHVLDQCGWSVAEYQGKWYAQDRLGTVQASADTRSEALSAAVTKALGEKAVSAYLKASAKAMAPPTTQPLDPSQLSRTGRRLPPGINAPANPADVPAQARLDEAKRQSAAVPLERNAAGNLIAPDGQRSELREDQWRQVRTPGFKGFFGDWQADPAGSSKIVDGHGEPRVMYRGTGGGLTPDMKPNARRQIYLSTDPSFADSYGKGQWEVYANARNPWDYQDADHLEALRRSLEADKDFRFSPAITNKDNTSQKYQDAMTRARATTSHAQSVEDAMYLAEQGDWQVIDRYPVWDHMQRLMANGGHDGVWIEENGVRNLIVPDARQVKSATHNAGTFDPSVADTRFAIRDTAQKVLDDAQERRQTEDGITKGYDAVRTRAGLAGHQAGISVRLDIPDDLDRQATGPVVEAGGRRDQLTADLAKVQASPDQKLAAKYTPIYQRALDHLDRLHAAAQGYRNIDLAQDAAMEKAGLGKDWQARVKHVYDDPDAPEATVIKDKGFGSVAGFKTAAAAIASGVDPGSVDLADLAQRRVRRAQEAINERAFHDTLAELKTTDGKPAVQPLGDSSSHLTEGGSVSASAKVPAGYEAIDAGGNVLAVHKQFAPILHDLYGTSALREHPLGNLLLNAAALAKHGSIGVLDTYHACTTALRGLLGFNTAGWERGKAATEYTPADLDRAVAAGEITQRQADYARQNAKVIQRGLKAGLNIDRFSDNLLESAKQHNLIERIPVLGKLSAKINDYTFHTVQRGVMTQAYVVAEARNAARFPELSQDAIARRAAKEVNEFFGSLGNQGWLRNKTLQDAARIVFLAPGFAEGRLRTELRGAGQVGRVPFDLATGKGLRVGVVAQALGGVALAGIIGNQALNMFTRGEPTWKNPEDDHKFDAWIPGGPHDRGFWFSPLSIASEYAHALHKYTGAGESLPDAAAHIVSNKLSGPARALKELATGQDWRGQPYGSTGDRLKAAAADALPLPLPAGPWITKDPKSPTGYGFNHQKGALEKQLLAMIGIKLDTADSARSQMYRLADAYRAKNGGGDGLPGLPHPAHMPSPYSDLRRALDNEDDEGARSEVRKLTAAGHGPDKIGAALGLRPDGTVAPEYFTGKPDSEQAMIRTMTEPQKETWRQAQRDRIANARRYHEIVGTNPPAGIPRLSKPAEPTSTKAGQPK